MFFGALLAITGCAMGVATGQQAEKHYKVTHSESEWRKLLPTLPFEVLRHAATERAYTGKLLDVHSKGVFVCAGCALELFSSDTKFESGTGWPSFWKPINAKAVDEIEDRTDGMVRTEVRCSRCGGHLGHVFDDGPKPTGLRYCMNSAAMKFVAAKKKL